MLHYCHSHSTPEPVLLQELVRETHLSVMHPRMLSEWPQGLLLQILAKLAQPRHMLEIGTFTGYSAICLAEGMHPQGVLHTFDINDETLELARQFIARTPHAAQIVLHHQSALEGVPPLGCIFDMVFIDGDKREYPAYYEMVMQHTHPGSLIIADNVLWSGKVLDTAHPGDKHTLALQEFNNMVRDDTRVQKLMLPHRDGLLIMLRN